MLKRVISGAQTGVDQAALYAAEKAGLLTGGHVTKGCNTLAGPQPDLIKRFRLSELKTDSYAKRTWKNVEMSGGTLRIAYDFGTFGERCTMNAIKKFARPHMDVPADDLLDNAESWHDRVHKWLSTKNIEILNVAGNADTFLGSRQIGPVAYAFLLPLFERFKEH